MEIKLALDYTHTRIKNAFVEKMSHFFIKINLFGAAEIDFLMKFHQKTLCEKLI